MRNSYKGQRGGGTKQRTMYWHYKLATADFCERALPKKITPQNKRYPQDLWERYTLKSGPLPRTLPYKITSDCPCTAIGSRNFSISHTCREIWREKMTCIFSAILHRWCPFSFLLIHLIKSSKMCG